MELEQLYQAVYEAPRDDERKLVLADALQVAGDPRGDFISLQMRDSVITRRRSEKLLARHRDAFLGPLKPAVISASGERWEKGFLVECTVRLPGTLADCGAWATVQAIHLFEGEAEPVELASKWFGALKTVRIAGSREFAERAHALVASTHRGIRVRHVDHGR